MGDVIVSLHRLVGRGSRVILNVRSRRAARERRGCLVTVAEKFDHVQHSLSIPYFRPTADGILCLGRINYPK